MSVIIQITNQKKTYKCGSEKDPLDLKKKSLITIYTYLYCI